LLRFIMCPVCTTSLSAERHRIKGTKAVPGAFPQRKTVVK
jgi:hypothetical protein